MQMDIDQEQKSMCNCELEKLLAQCQQTSLNRRLKIVESMFQVLHEQGHTNITWLGDLIFYLSPATLKSAMERTGIPIGGSNGQG